MMNPSKPMNIAININEVKRKKLNVSQHEKVHSTSDNIPLPRCHIRRTASELQLCEDMAAAEWRERCMFHRLIKGMQKRQEDICASQCLQEQYMQKLHTSNEIAPRHQMQSKCNNTLVRTDHREENIFSTRHRNDGGISASHFLHNQDLPDNTLTYDDSFDNASFGFLPALVMTVQRRQHCHNIFGTDASVEYRVPSVLVVNNDDHGDEIFDIEM
eukprot:5805640-Ditylum_brightwellii.AAC.1